MTKEDIEEKCEEAKVQTTADLCRKIINDEINNPFNRPEADIKSFNKKIREANVILTRKGLSQNNIVLVAQNKSPELLLLGILRVCDFYRNTDVAKQFTQTKNESTYFADHIQNLANTLLKYGSGGSMDIGVMLRHVKNTIKTIRDTRFRGGNSRLVGTLERLYNHFCSNTTEQYPIHPGVTALPLTVVEFLQIQSPNDIAVYKRRHIVNKVRESLALYEDHLNNSFAGIFKYNKPYKKTVAKELHQELEKLYRPDHIVELDNNPNPNAVAEKIQLLLQKFLSGTDGKKQLSFFSQDKFGESKRAIEKYLRDISQPRAQQYAYTYG